MTKIMKVEILAYYVLKGLVYLFATVGTLCVIGFAGGLTADKMSILQFCLHEIYAFCLIGLAYGMCFITEVIKKDFIKRDRLLQRKQRQKVRAVYN